ncbi:unannotated protein [freshwater metagenome]|uniref:Unannotated protein n=1 Tax=freshwater metagenome TaxID=449393 RepID=A0A6J6HLB2_9ZZZZ|nr:hypothetical protein [Actinomycetota bacterium]
MKKALLLLPLLVGLVACGKTADSAASNTVAPSTASTTLPIAATTTLPIFLNPASGEKEVACDNKAIGAIYGEKLLLEKCTTTWAFGDTDRDRWNCPDEGCQQTRLFHLDGAKWINTTTCQRSLPLTRFFMSCYIPSVGAATLKELPPSDVACIIWPANKSLKYAVETGCEPDLASITASLSEKCTGYFAASELPVEKCDQGQAVQLMQARLRKAGYSTSVDGYYGPAMALAVYKFQKDKGLMKSGMIDLATWKALEPDQSTLPGTDTNGDGVISPNELR